MYTSRFSISNNRSSTTLPILTIIFTFVDFLTVSASYVVYVKYMCTDRLDPAKLKATQKKITGFKNMRTEFSAFVSMIWTTVRMPGMRQLSCAKENRSRGAM